jgi:hypothetical protein
VPLRRILNLSSGDGDTDKEDELECVIPLQNPYSPSLY